MQTVTIPVDNEIIFALKTDIPRLQSDFMQTLAVRYFKEGRLGLGLASRMAGLSKNDFVQALSRYDIDIYQYNDDELHSEFALADEIAGGVKS
jgi:predicted HTH domain antitoxin